MGSSTTGQSKRTNFRRLHQMHGDFLLELKKPVCSELSRDVTGHNHSHVVDLRKQLKVMYKERDIELAKVKRGQDAVYSTLLKVHKMKKISQRQAYKHMQEDTRGRATRRSLDSVTRGSHDTVTTGRLDSAPHLLESMESDKQLITDDLEEKETSESVLPQPQVTSEAKSAQAQNEGVRRARVLEVRKGALQEPLVSERTITLPANKLDDVEPDISEDQDLCGEEAEVSSDNVHRFSRIHPGVLQKGNKSKRGRKKHKYGIAGPELPERRRSSCLAPPLMPAIDEQSTALLDSKRTSTPLSHSKVKVKWEVSGSPGRPLEAASESSSTVVLENRGSLSQAQMNRLKALEREQRMKDILNCEPITLYTRDDSGNIVPSIMGFHRRTFEAPSLREKHFQHKMLRAQREARLSQEHRLEAFLSKLEAEGQQRQRQRETRQEVFPPQEDRSRHLANENRVTLPRLVAAFNRQVELPAGVEPASFEALKNCKYLREYSPAERTKRRKSRRERGQLV